MFLNTKYAFALTHTRTSMVLRQVAGIYEMILSAQFYLHPPISASCHGKWGRKPSSWPEYVIFVNPNNGTWNDGMW